jgi:hypothetical protein
VSVAGDEPEELDQPVDRVGNPVVEYRGAGVEKCKNLVKNTWETSLRSGTVP